jgi:hypothetical protein
MTTMVDTRRARSPRRRADRRRRGRVRVLVEVDRPGRQPPDFSAERGRTAELIADDATWTLIALVDGEPAGHAAFFPARRRPPARRRTTGPGAT